MSDRRDELPTPFERATLDGVYHRVEASPRGRGRARGPSRVQAVALAASIALCVFGVALWIPLLFGEARHPDERPGRPALLRADGGAFVGEVHESVALADGSELELGAASALRVRENDGQVLSLELVRGRARFSVRPNGPRLWTVDAGEVRVQVHGTRFWVRRDEADVGVSVEEGLVSVRAQARTWLLGPGERWSLAALAAPEGATRPVASAPVANDLPSETAASAETAGSSGTLEAPAAPEPTWRDLVRRGEHHAAFAELELAGLSPEVRRASDVATLFALADAARLSGHPRAAFPPLARITREFSRDERAALAAFTAGRIELEAFDHRDAARTWFERALDLGLSGSLRAAAIRRRDELAESAE